MAKTTTLRFLGGIGPNLIADKAITRNKLANEVDDLLVDLEDGVKAAMNNKSFHTVYYDTSTHYLHFLDENDEDVYDPVYIEGGGGSGGGSSISYTITFKNLSESRTFSIAEGDAAEIKVEYTSVDEEGYDDGPGVGTLYINGVRRTSLNIVQGENTINVAPYLAEGSNTVKIKVENTEGLSKSISYTVNVVSISVTTTHSQFMKCSGDTAFYYRVVGSGTKTIHFVMDGTEIGTETTESSGKSLTYTIPTQSHGGHVFECYATTEVDEITVQSESLVLGMIWVEEGNLLPSIIMLSDIESMTQGEALFLPYMVNDPSTETPVVTYTIFNEDGTEYFSQDYTVSGTSQEWVVQDCPVGNVRFRISIGEIYAETTVAVSESDITFETISDNLVLDFNPKGRSNKEDTPDVWTNGTVSAEFTDIGFAESDGWLNDATGSTKLRLLPGGEMTIPFMFFATDKRDAGATIEVEMATHNVRDYDSVVISSLSGGRGIKIASQYAQFNSEQSEISMQFVEDKRIRVSFVIEPRNLNRLIYVYVNGIMCGALQYPEDDNFAQNPAVGITIGAESSGIDVYRILMYNKGLEATELTENFVADRPTFAERIAAHNRNDILNTSGDVVISKLPATLPYMIISCAELPQSKGDKKTCTIEYVNPSDKTRSFTAEGVQIDVQGTSSSGYKKKNFKEKFKNGITYTIDNTIADGYAIRSNSIPVDEICMKADVASSEGANNVELVRLYNDVCLTIYKTDAQIADERVRVGIDGVPCIVFWCNTDTGETKFWGKYNLNNEKANSEVYGLTEGCESWEILNNTSDRVLFKSADFEGTEWMKDFEARYPEDNTDTTNLQRMMEWVVSTDRSTVDTEEEKQALLDKFKNEFEDYFVKDPMIFYYIFTEVFMMVDNRAKNFFPTTYDGVHWMPLPYDMDTAIGINNEGQLVFDYDLEDDEALDGKDVFNSRYSVLWMNVRDAFQDEIKEMYTTLRSQTNTLFSYEKIIERFDEHQSVWPETIWNEDAYEKYLEPLLSDKDGSYLSMMQGDKSSQREWWLYNGFRYRDSKYQCGDANKNYITIRCYEAAEITVTPYSHIWPRLQYDGSVGSGDGYVLTERGKRNVPVTFACPMATLNDTPVYIFSADRLCDIGDLSPLKVGWANFSAATKLMILKLGDGAEGYENPNLETLQIGANELLVEVDVRNCTKLKQPVDMSGCTGLERVYASGSALTAITLPVGGKVKYLELPETITNFTIRNHKQFETLVMNGYDALATFRVENTPNIPIEDIILNAPNLERVRLIGIEWEVESEEVLQTALTKLESCGGLDATAGNLDNAVVNGRVYIDSISSELLDYIYDTFPELVVVVNGEVNYVVRYIGSDGTVLYKAVVAEGEDAIDPIEAGYLTETPTKTGSDEVQYEYIGWTNIPMNVQNNTNVYAVFTEKLRVRFYNDTELLHTAWVVSGEDVADPITAGTITAPTKTSTAQYNYTYSGWDADLSSITEPKDVYAQFTATVRTYTVYFYNYDNTLLYTATNVPYGGSASFVGDLPTNNSTGNTADFTFRGWNPQPTNITGDTKCYAQFNDLREIADSWATIASNVANGTATSKYGIGAFKTLDIGAKTLPCDFKNGQAVVWNDEIHILGGASSSWKHYKWNGSEWVEVSTLPYAFYQGSAVVYNGEIHLLGASGYGEKHYKWNGTEWTSVSTLPYTFSYASAVVCNGEIHILGADDSSYRTSHYKWNGTEWTSVSTLPYSFNESSAVVFEDEIHILASKTSSNRTSHYKFDGSAWTSVSTLPYNFYSSSAVVFEDEIHIMGSYDSSYRTSHYKWNGTEWVSVSTLPYSFYQGSAVVYCDLLHILGTNSSGYANSFYSYSTETEKWSKVGITESIPMQLVAHNHDSLPEGVVKWESIGSLPVNFAYGCTAILNKEIHILGGNGSSNYKYHYKWNGSSWTSVSTLPYDFFYGSSVVYNDEIHIFGCGNATYRMYHYKWDGLSWTSVSTLPYQFYYGSAVVYDDEIHIMGGKGNQTAHYKWNGSEWTSVSTLPYSFYDASAVVIGGEVHILGSQASGNQTAHYKWNGTEWVSVSTLPYNFYQGSVVVYNDEIHILGCNTYQYYASHYKWNDTEWVSVSTLPYNFHQGSVVVYDDKITLLGSYNQKKAFYALDMDNPKATLTFIAKNLLSEPRVMNDTLTNVGGWSAMPLRSYLNGDFLATLPSDLQSAITTVAKLSDGGYGDKTIKATNDKVWILSHEETTDTVDSAVVVGQGTKYELFTNNNSRIMKTIDGVAQAWWVRSSSSTNMFFRTNNAGKASVVMTNSAQYLLIGFCI